MKLRKVDRRRFLRDAIGPVLPLPFLHCMASKASSATHTEVPLRFVTLFKPNGVHPPSWNINGGSEFDFRMSPMMAPFEKHKDDLLILDNMGDFGFSSHANSTRRFLSGHHRNTNSASVDQIIADKIRGESPVRSLELTTEGLFPNQIGCSYISYDQQGEPIPRESDPQLVFDRLFRNPMQNVSRRKELKSVLDRVIEDSRDLLRHSGVEDRRILDQYLSVVRGTEKKLDRIAEQTPDIQPATLQRPLAPGNLDEQVEAMLDLIAVSLWTDSTRCVSYMLGNSNSRMIFDFLGISEQHHYLSHFFRNFSRPNLDALLKISLWHMEKFDSLMNRLKGFSDHSGRLLDHCVVLFGSGMGHSDNHTATRIPIVLAGQGSGRLKTGRYLRYAENQELGSLHLSLLRLFGVDVTRFGESQMPLPGLDGSPFEAYQEKVFESWIRYQGEEVEVQGRLRLSDDLNEARIFYVDVKGSPPLRIDVEFRDFHHFNLAYHCGTPIRLRAQWRDQNGSRVITKLETLDSLFGKAPGTARG